MSQPESQSFAAASEPSLGLLCWAASWRCDAEGDAHAVVFVDLEAEGRLKAAQAALPSLTERSTGIAVFGSESIVQAAFNAAETQIAPKKGQSEAEALRSRAARMAAANELRKSWRDWTAIGFDEAGAPASFEPEDIASILKGGFFEKRQLVCWLSGAAPRAQNAETLQEAKAMAQAALDAMASFARAALGETAVFSAQILSEKADDEPEVVEGRIAGLAMSIRQRKALQEELAARLSEATTPPPPPGRPCEAPKRKAKAL